MPSNPLNVIFTGATGYIGGAVLEKFISIPNLSIKAIVRSPEKAEKLKSFGVTPVLGSLDDLQLVEQQASETDVFIALANCDDLSAAQATLRGLKTRFEQTGKKPSFISTSGTGELTVDTKGLSSTEVVYDDMNIEQIQSLPDTAIHRNVDSFIDREGEKGYVDTYILLPSVVWGIASGKLADAGIVNKLSMQNPLLMNIGIARGQAAMPGKGLNVWPHVEIHELADLYVILFNAILEGAEKNPALANGRAGYYFGTNGEYLTYDVAKIIGQVLYEHGKSKSPEPTTLTQEEIDHFLAGSGYMGSSSRCVANRSKALGWRPVKTTDDFLKSTVAEMELSLKTGYNPMSSLP